MNIICSMNTLKSCAKKCVYYLVSHSKHGIEVRRNLNMTLPRHTVFLPNRFVTVTFLLVMKFFFSSHVRM